MDKEKQKNISNTRKDSNEKKEGRKEGRKDYLEKEKKVKN